MEVILPLLFGIVTPSGSEYRAACGKPQSPINSGGPMRYVVMAMLMALTWFDLNVSHASTSVQYESLSGVTGIFVLVEDLKDEVQRDGLSKEQIQTDVELRLQQSGIKVLSQKESVASPGAPYLYLRLNTYKAREISAYAFNVEVHFYQTVQLVRKPAMTLSGVTWHARGITGIVGASNLRDVLQFVADPVDEFINVYLVANPK